MRLWALSAAIIGFGCVGHQPLPTSAGATADKVQVWLTTGDQKTLLSRQPDLATSSETELATASVIDVDASQKFQDMIGFGAAMTDASAHVMQGVPANERERLLADLFGRDSGIGFSFMRVPMGASDFSMRHYTYDDVPAGQTDAALDHFSIEADRAEKLPLLRRALAINSQLKIVASPWTAPAWMKTTGSLIKGTLESRFYDSFAEYFLKFVRAYNTEGVPVFAITLQNEPAFEPDNYSGMRLDPSVRAAIVGRHLGPLFAREGIATLIWDWDHNWDQPQQPTEVLSDPAARQYVEGVAWHCYGGDVGAQGTVHDKFPEKSTYFTECSGGEWSPKFADNLKWTVANLIIGATRNWARGSLMWNLALDENHGPHLGGCGDCRGVVTVDSRTGKYRREAEYYAFGHASKFVRPGARRVASTTLADLPNVAFQNDDGSMVLVVLNAGSAIKEFVVRDDGKTFRYSLAQGAVVTFVW